MALVVSEVWPLTDFVLTDVSTSEQQTVADESSKFRGYHATEGSARVLNSTAVRPRQH
jgi:hypothetical protein